MFSANNYGYNPYGRYVSQQPMQQPVQPMQPIEPVRTNLQGKQVESVDVVKATDIPLDGSISYFPLTDGSAIITKQLQANGTSKTLIYKQIVEEQEEAPAYITAEEFEKTIKDLKKQIKDLKKEVKDE